MRNTGQAAIGFRVDHQNVAAQNNRAQAMARAREVGLAGSATQRKLSAVIRKKDGVSQNALNPYASNAIPSARSHTNALRDSSHTAQARVETKIAKAVAP